MKQLSNNVFKWGIHALVILGDCIIASVVMLILFGAYTFITISMLIMELTTKGRKAFSDGYDVTKKNSEVKDADNT